VLLRGRTPIPRAHEALLHLKSQRIPFILLTNGGGKTEESRAKELSWLLDVRINADMVIQSHTPFARFPAEQKERTVLVVGGEGDNGRLVAES
jgi:ribonucleotide monophosphatase NagD (HAD superfamily)